MAWKSRFGGSTIHKVDGVEFQDERYILPYGIAA